MDNWKKLFAGGSLDEGSTHMWVKIIWINHSLENKDPPFKAAFWCINDWPPFCELCDVEGSQAGHKIPFDLKICKAYIDIFPV